MTYENKKITDYLNDTCTYVKNKKVHKEIKLELQSHIDDIIDECLASGMSMDESVNEAISHIGPANMVGSSLNKAHKAAPDWILILITSILIGFGLFTISYLQSNVATNDLMYSSNLLVKSSIYLIAGLLISLIFIKLDFRSIKKYSYHVYFFSVGLLVLSLKISMPVNGVLGWIAVGPVTFNAPSLMTFTLIISLAGIFDKYDWDNKMQLLKGFLLSFAPIILLLLHNSVSASILYLICAISIMAASGLKIKQLLICVSSIGVLLFCYISSAPYRIERFMMMVNPAEDPTYTILSGIKKSAVPFGKSDNVLNQLPDAHTDFVLSSVISCFGWIVAIILLSVIAAFIIRLILVGKSTKDSYGKLLVCGISSLFMTQFIISILSNMSLIPSLNIGMPFISYGGSQLLISILGVALINNIYKNRNTPYAELT